MAVSLQSDGSADSILQSDTDEKGGPGGSGTSDSGNKGSTKDVAATSPVDDTVGKPRPLPRAVVAVIAGAVSGALTHWLPNAITLGGIPVGDVGPPLVGLQRALEGLSPYGMSLRDGPLAQYPFVTMVILAPLLLVPLVAVAGVFGGLSGAALAWALTSKGQWWRLMMLLSVPFVMSLYSVQWSPLFTAALFWSPLLFLAVVKPQLGLALVFAGHWRRGSVVAAIAIVVVSFVVRPTWLVEWFNSGVLGQYDARVPVLIAPGFLLFGAALLIRSRSGRLLASMALIPQRFWYDQLLLFMVPATWRQMMVLVLTSWMGLWWCLAHGWDPASGWQDLWVWRVVVMSLYLPGLAIAGWQWYSSRSARRQVASASLNS